MLKHFKQLLIMKYHLQHQKVMYYHNLNLSFHILSQEVPNYSIINFILQQQFILHLLAQNLILLILIFLQLNLNFFTFMHLNLISLLKIKILFINSIEIPQNQLLMLKDQDQDTLHYFIEIIPVVFSCILLQFISLIVVRLLQKYMFFICFHLMD